MEAEDWTLRRYNDSQPMAMMHVVESINDSNEMGWFSERIREWIRRQKREIYYALGPNNLDDKATYGIFLQDIRDGWIHLCFIGTHKKWQKQGHASDLLQKLMFINPSFQGLRCCAREAQLEFYEEFAKKHKFQTKIEKTYEFYPEPRREPKYSIKIYNGRLIWDSPHECRIKYPSFLEYHAE